MAALTDESPMPYGEHKGTAMANDPASRLIWLYENGKAWQGVAEYVKENWDALQAEVNRNK